MSQTFGIVDVTSHLPLAQRRFGSEKLLRWIVRRISDTQHLQGVVVLVFPSQAEAVHGLVPSDVQLVEVPEADALLRCREAARQLDAHGLIQVDLQHPFVDPELIDRLVVTARDVPQVDVIAFRARDASPLKARLGMVSQWIRAAVLGEADREAQSVSEREDFTRFMCAHPERFVLRLIPAPAGLDRSDLRLALENEEDWEHAQLIYDALGPDALDWRRISRLLEQQPQLRQRMQWLNQVEQSRN